MFQLSCFCQMYVNLNSTTLRLQYQPFGFGMLFCPGTLSTTKERTTLESSGRIDSEELEHVERMIAEWSSYFLNLTLGSQGFCRDMWA